MICHLGLLYLHRASFALGDRQHSYLLPLSFLLYVLHKRHMKGSSLRVLPTSLTLHSFGVTLFALGFRLFLIQLQINTQRPSPSQTSFASSTCIPRTSITDLLVEQQHLHTDHAPPSYALHTDALSTRRPSPNCIAIHSPQKIGKEKKNNMVYGNV